MSAVEPQFSTQLLDRFLVVAHSYDLEPRILITKKDLTTQDNQEYIQVMLDLYQDIGYPTQFISKNDDRVSIVDEWNHGLIVLSGQSGVGKTTFLNHYRPELNLETNDISKSLNRGKHTTRHVELYERNHGFIADTPGFSALDFDHIEKDELKNYFVDIKDAGQNCKFRNCNHIKEPKCNVKHLVDEGKLLNLDMSIIYSYLMKSLIERYDING